jgi:RsiW-degrading membrane proteinase PrsW (M82 family)
MRPSTRSKLLRVAAVVLGVGTVAFAVLGFVLIKDGAYPPEGTGSLGHVGMVIAGAIAAFLALVLGLFTALCISKVRADPNTDRWPA